MMIINMNQSRLEHLHESGVQLFQRLASLGIRGPHFRAHLKHHSTDIEQCKGVPIIPKYICLSDKRCDLFAARRLKKQFSEAMVHYHNKAFIIRLIITHAIIFTPVSIRTDYFPPYKPTIQTGVEIYIVYTDYIYIYYFSPYRQTGVGNSPERDYNFSSKTTF